MAFVKVAKVSGIPSGLVLGYEVDGKKVAIANVGGKFHAFEDRCTHLGGKLSKGLLMGNMVMCPLHGAQFDVTTGRPAGSPANGPVTSYAVRVEGDDILVDI